MKLLFNVLDAVVRYLDRRTNRLVRSGAPSDVCRRAGRLELRAARLRGRISAFLLRYV